MPYVKCWNSVLAQDNNNERKATKNLKTWIFKDEFNPIWDADSISNQPGKDIDIILVNIS